MESQLRPARISAVTFERSTNSFRAPRPLRMPPVDAFTQIAELGRRYRHRSVHSLWPDEAAALQPLGEQAHALAVVPQHLDQTAAFATKHEKIVPCGSRFSVYCTSSAKPSKPLRLCGAPHNRKGADGLAALVREQLRHDPFSGTIFVFRSKRADRLKILVWDGTGLVLLWKRLEQNAFRWPPISDGVMRLSASQLAALMDGLDWSRLHAHDVAQPSAAS